MELVVLLIARMDSYVLFSAIQMKLRGAIKHIPPFFRIIFFVVMPIVDVYKATKVGDKMRMPGFTSEVSLWNEHNTLEKSLYSEALFPFGVQDIVPAGSCAAGCLSGGTCHIECPIGKAAYCWCSSKPFCQCGSPYH